MIAAGPSPGDDTLRNNAVSGSSAPILFTLNAAQLDYIYNTAVKEGIVRKIQRCYWAVWTIQSRIELSDASI